MHWSVVANTSWRAFSRKLVGLVLASILLGHGGFIAGQESEANQKRESDAKLLDGLRQRRLFDVADSYCRDQLTQTAIDLTTQSTLVVELMKTQTAKAILSSPNDRNAVWQSVETTSTDFLRNNPEHPRQFLVRVQQALSHIAHGRLLRQELDADMATASARDEALKQIRTARTLLGNLQRDITKAIPDQRGRKLSEHELTSEQLMTLNTNVQYQLAVCNLNRAQLYEASDRLNRIDALNSVNQRLLEVQRYSSEGQTLWWKTKLGQVECLRLLGAPPNARALIESLPAKKASPSIRILLLEQKIRVATDLGNEQYSRSVLTEFNKLSFRSAQLEMALIELTVDLAARAKTEERKQEWISFAAEMSKSIEKKYGGYWGRRADLVLIEATGVANNGTSAIEPVKANNPDVPTSNGSNNVELDLLIRLADEKFRKELLDDALKAYDRAAGLALSLNEMDQALLMDFRAGKILEKQAKHELAAKRMTESAIRNAQLSLAPSAHLVGIWNFAKTIEKDQPEKRKQFVDLLLDHLRRWSSKPSADQARIWLASEYQAEQKWKAAFDVYIQVGNTSTFLKTAITQAIACANRALLVQGKTGGSTQSLAAQLIGRLSSKRDSLQKTDPIVVQLLFAQIELDLVFGSRQPNAVFSKTLEPLESSPDGSIANTARALHAASVSVEATDKARQLVAQIANDEVALGLCERCLTGILDRPASSAHLQSLHALRLLVIETALAIPAMQQPGNESRKTTWMLKRSTELAALGRHAESIEVLTELEKKFPRNAGVQMQLARAMSIQFGKSDPQKPLDKWRRIAARLRSHTPNWYEAKYEVARLLHESGDSQSAAKLLKYIQANPPGWDKSDLKPKFETLLRTCEGG